MLGYTYGDDQISQYDNLEIKDDSYKISYLFKTKGEAEKFEKLLKSDIGIAEEDYMAISLESLKDGIMEDNCGYSGYYS